MKFLVAASVAVLAGLTSALPTTTAPVGVLPNEACTSSACKSAAAYIKAAINESANPCDNFFEYACGGWVQNHEIPDAKSRSGTFDVLNEQMNDRIRSELSAVNETDPSTAQSVRFAAHSFNRCVELANEHNPVGLSLLRGVYAHTYSGLQKIAWDNMLALSYANSAISPIFALNLSPDPKNNTANIINIDPANLGLGDKELSNLTANARAVDAYRQYIRSVGKVVCEAAHITNCNASNIETDVEAIVNFESELAKIRLSPEEKRDPNTVYNKFTLKDLQTKTGFDWLSLFKNILKSLKSQRTIDENVQVLVSDVNYLVKAIKILEGTDERTISAYFGWKVFSQFGPYTSEEFRKIKFEFDKVINGVKQLEVREKVCQNFVYDSLNMALSRLFVNKYFTKTEKDAASALIDSIQASFHDIIKANDWLDEETRTKSFEKLQHVTKNVAYPDWIMKNDELDKFYALTAELFQSFMDEKNYLISLARFNAAQNKKKIEEYDVPMSFEMNWPMPPAIINAAYEPLQNSITIPAGILKSPFFDPERPYSINYGFIGVVIGHEFTHGFDDQGAQFDFRGNQRDWWTKTAKEHYEERSKCFVDQYGSKIDPITGLHLNGKNTLGENIADNGGIAEAYNAFRTRETKEGKSITLADLPQFSSEQLYFLSFAQTWCSKIRPEKLKLQILYDPHSPAKFRVEVPTWNSKAFHKVFNCPARADQQECKLW